MIKYEKLKFLKKSFNKSYKNSFLMTPTSKAAPDNFFVEKSRISYGPVTWNYNKSPYTKRVRRPLFPRRGFEINKLLLVFWYGDRLYLGGLKNRQINPSYKDKNSVLNNMARGGLLGYSQIPKVLGNSYNVRIPPRANSGPFWRIEAAPYTPLTVLPTEKKDLLRPGFFQEANSFYLTTYKTIEAQAYQNNVYLYLSTSITFSNIKNRNQKYNPRSKASNSDLLHKENLSLDLRGESKGPRFLTTSNSEHTLPDRCKGVGKNQQGFINAGGAVTKSFYKVFSNKRGHAVRNYWDFNQCFIKKSSGLKKLTNTHFGLKVNQCSDITKQSFTPWRLANVLTFKWAGFNNTKGVLNINSNLILSYCQNTSVYDLEHSLRAKNDTLVRQRAVSVDDCSTILEINTLGHDISYLLKKAIKKCRSLPYSILIIYLNRFLIFFEFFSKVISNKTVNINLLYLFRDFDKQRSLTLSPGFIRSNKLSKIKIPSTAQFQKLSILINTLLSHQQFLLISYFRTRFDSSTIFLLKTSFFDYLTFGSSTNTPGYLVWPPLNSTANDPGTTRIKKGLRKTKEVGPSVYNGSTFVNLFVFYGSLNKELSTKKTNNKNRKQYILTTLYSRHTPRFNDTLVTTFSGGLSFCNPPYVKNITNNENLNNKKREQMFQPVGKSNVPATAKEADIIKKLTKTLSFVRANLFSFYRFNNTKVSVAQVIQYVEDYERCSVFPLSGNTAERPSFSRLALPLQAIIALTASVLWQYNKKNQNKNSLISVFKKFWLTLPIDYFYLKIKKVGNIVENSGKKSTRRPSSSFFTTRFSQSSQGPSTTGRTLLSRKWFLTNGRHAMRIDINLKKSSNFQKMKLLPDYFFSQYSLPCFFSLPAIRFKQETLKAQCLAERNYSKKQHTLSYNVVPLYDRALTSVYTGSYNTPIAYEAYEAYELIQTLKEFTQHLLFKGQGHIVILTKSSIAELQQSDSLYSNKVDSLSFLKSYRPQSTTTKSQKEIIHENSTIKDLWFQTKRKRSLFFKNVIKKRFTQSQVYSNNQINEHSILNWTDATFSEKAYFVKAQRAFTKSVVSGNKTTPLNSFFFKKTNKSILNMGISLACNKVRPRQQRVLHKWVVLFVLSKRCVKQEHKMSYFEPQNDAYGGQKRPAFKNKKINQCFDFITKPLLALRPPQCVITINWEHVYAHNHGTATYTVYLSKDNFIVKDFIKGQLGFCSRIAHMYGGLFLNLFRFKKYMLRQSGKCGDVDTVPAFYLGLFLRRKNRQLSYEAMLTPKPCRRYCYSTYPSFTKKRSFVTDFKLDKSNFRRIFNDNIALKTTETVNKTIKAFNTKTKNHKTKFSVYTYFFFND